MPRKYVKKADQIKLAEEAKKIDVSRETEPTAKDMLAEVMANQNEIMKQNIELKAENDRLKDALIQNPAEGGRRIVGGKDEGYELPIQEQPMDPEDYAVFTSPSPGLQQRLISREPDWHANGEKTLHEPVFARFEKGICVLMEPEQIEAMRAREKKDKIKGTIKFVELTDAKQKEAARKGLLGARSIKSQTVTSETPLSDLV